MLWLLSFWAINTELIYYLTIYDLLFTIYFPLKGVRGSLSEQGIEQTYRRCHHDQQAKQTV